MSLQIGVLGVQGAVSEHVDALKRAAADAGRDVEVTVVRSSADLAEVDGLVMPGGESTTISRLLRSGGLQDPLLERAKKGDLALFGTCAGMILLCSEAVDDVTEKDIELLGLLDARVDRNAFGRQRESFETRLPFVGVGQVPAVFIRAPVAVREWGDTHVLARVREGAVALQDGVVLATAFHPELTPDARVHQHFLDLVGQVARRRAEAR